MISYEICESEEKKGYGFSLSDSILGLSDETVRANYLEGFGSGFTERLGKYPSPTRYVNRSIRSEKHI